MKDEPFIQLIEQAARARRLALVLHHSDPTGPELEKYAKELEAEIRRRVEGSG